MDDSANESSMMSSTRSLRLDQPLFGTQSITPLLATLFSVGRCPQLVHPPSRYVQSFITFILSLVCSFARRKCNQSIRGHVSVCRRHHHHHHHHYRHGNRLHRLCHHHHHRRRHHHHHHHHHIHHFHNHPSNSKFLKATVQSVGKHSEWWIIQMCSSISLPSIHVWSISSGHRRSPRTDVDLLTFDTQKCLTTVCFSRGRHSSFFRVAIASPHSTWGDDFFPCFLPKRQGGGGASSAPNDVPGFLPLLFLYCTFLPSVKRGIWMFSENSLEDRFQLNALFAWRKWLSSFLKRFFNMMVMMMMLMVMVMMMMMMIMMIIIIINIIIIIIKSVISFDKI